MRTLNTSFFDSTLYIREKMEEKEDERRVLEEDGTVASQRNVGLSIIEDPKEEEMISLLAL